MNAKQFGIHAGKVLSNLAVEVKNMEPGARLTYWGVADMCDSSDSTEAQKQMLTSAYESMLEHYCNLGVLKEHRRPEERYVKQ